MLFGGFAFGQPTADRQRRMPSWTRMTSSLALVAAGWTWFVASQGHAAPFPLLIALGMTCGFVGDLSMARWLPISQPVLAGMGAFGLGHVAYIAGIVALTNQYGLGAHAARWLAWLVWLLVGLLGWYFVIFRGAPRHTSLHLAALPYALLLASTAGAATGLALVVPRFTPLALGAALFLASDLLLAARLFRGVCFRLSDDLVWLLYGPAQMLIVYSVSRALPPL
jgi:hypothetical protein